MTRHITEDTLIELSLGLLAADTEKEVRNHLEECSMCIDLSRDVEQTLDCIKNAAPEVGAAIPALSSPRQDRFGWFRLAAMLLVGFGLGLLASESLLSQAVNVIPQQVVSRPPQLPAAGFVPCEGVDISWRGP